MANNKNGFVTDVSSFFDRLKGQDRMKVSDHLTVLDSPESNKERQNKQKLQSIVQYVKNKNWNRRHVEFFEEYRRMVYTFPIVKAAVDIYAEEICAKDTDGNIFKIKCENKRVKDELEVCFFDNLNINAKAYLISREICKFGNVYAYISARAKDGVTSLTFLPPEAIIRENMYNPENLDDYRFAYFGGGGGSYYEPWEIVHWKNIEDIEMEPYGASILRPIIDTWRRVVLIREALVIYRITRAPSKLLFKINTDGMTGEEAHRFAQDMKKEVTKKPLVNPQTNEIDFKYNPISIEENIFMPTTTDSNSDVSVLEGAGNLDAVEDYKIIKDDLFAGLKIPKSFLSFEEDLSNKAALSEEDCRFAKTIQKHQTQFVEGLIHIGIVHLFLKGFSQEEMQSFTIEMNNPSTVAEKKRLELLQARLEIAKSAWDFNNPSLNLMSYVDVLRTILKFSDEEIMQTIRAQFAEKKIMWRLEQLRTNGTYEEPEVEKKLAMMKNLTGGDEKAPEGFEGLTFESGSLTEDLQKFTSNVESIAKRKIEEELGELIRPISGKASAKQIRSLTEGSLVRNLQEAKEDLGL